MSKKDQTKEKPQEQPTVGSQEQLQEQQGQEQPTEQPKEQPGQTEPKEQPKGGKKPAKESDADTAKRLMEEHGVREIHKAGSYWFKKLDDAESWAKQQGCKVESYNK